MRITDQDKGSEVWLLKDCLSIWQRRKLYCPCCGKNTRSKKLTINKPEVLKGILLKTLAAVGKCEHEHIYQIVVKGEGVAFQRTEDQLFKTREEAVSARNKINKKSVEKAYKRDEILRSQGWTLK